MNRKYEQAYRSEWEQEPSFSSWLCKSADGNSAFCKACNCKILSRMASLKEHSASAKHKKCLVGYSGSSQIDKYFKKSLLSEEVKNAELQIFALLLELIIPFRVMVHLSEVINRSFHDSDIAKGFSCKRTKVLCLPISNAKCERLFSDFNRIKTEYRNTFLNKNVASIIHAKEGLREVGNCTTFIPYPEMLKAMSDKKLYENIK